MDYMRVIVKEDVPLSTINSLAWNAGWLITDFVPEGRRQVDALFEEVFTANDEATHLRYIEDPTIHLHYFIVSGAQQKGTLREISDAVATYTAADIRELMKAASTPQQREKALYLAALATTPETTATTLRYLQDALTTDSVAVRRAAIIASVYTGWSELQKTVQRIADEDMDDDLRKLANQALARWASRSWHDPLS